MAPFRKQKHQKSRPNVLDKVQSGGVNGGVGLTSTRSRLNINASKELFPGIAKDQKLTAGKPAVCRPLSRSQSALNSSVRTEPVSKLGRTETIRAKPGPGLNRKAQFISKHNENQQKLRAVQDSIAKRNVHLRIDPDQALPLECLDAVTAPYSLASMNNALPSRDGPSKSTFEISCGFYRYTPTFTAGIAMTMSIDQFANPGNLRQAIFKQGQIQHSALQVGLHPNDPNISIVGFELSYPKGYRHRPAQALHAPGGPGMRYVGIGELVLVNSPCSLREFFLQTREFASDIHGSVQIPVIARIGLSNNPVVNGGHSVTPFANDWRSKYEKGWLAEEKRIALERQQFGNDDDRVKLYQRMRNIEAAADRAMEKAYKEKAAKNVSTRMRSGQEIVDRILDEAIGTSNNPDNGDDVMLDLSW